MTVVSSAQAVPVAQSDRDAIMITDLVKRFEGQHVDAIAQIHTNIARGTITGLVGPDGAGKTTFLRLLAGLLQPTSGKIKSMASIPSRKVMSCMSMSVICPRNLVFMKI